MTNIKKNNFESERVVNNLRERKKATLAFYEKSMGNITATCREIGISRQTFYRWCKNDKNFNQAVNNVSEANLDYAESMLLKNIKEGKEVSLIFFLKTKGKSRGYVERTEHDVTVNPFLELMKTATSDKDGE